MLTTIVATVTGCALGPGSRVVITRDGALGEPMPFVLALCGVAAMVCLVEPAPELTDTMPRTPRETRSLLVVFILLVCAAAVGVSSLLAPGLSAATTRNVLVALTVTFLVGWWKPLAAWIPNSAYLALSWFEGTPTYDDSARIWAVPAQAPDWPITAAWAIFALGAALVWALAPRSARVLHRAGR